jgi:hypothetical protein
MGDSPKDYALRPDTIPTTVFHALGLNPETEVRVNGPMILSAGSPCLPLFGVRPSPICGRKPGHSSPGFCLPW